jgi:hypothetical protein
MKAGATQQKMLVGKDLDAILFPVRSGCHLDVKNKK